MRGYIVKTRMSSKGTPPAEKNHFIITSKLIVYIYIQPKLYNFYESVVH